MGVPYIIRTPSARAAHAALRIAQAVELLERMGLDRHAVIEIRFDGRKCTVAVPSLSFGATLVPEADTTAETGATGVE